MISVVLPIYLPTERHRRMTDKCICLAKMNTNIDVEWVIVETCSKHYESEADIYIYEPDKTTPNKSINRGFKVASGDYVIFLANDVFVGDKWVEHLLECFDIKDCGLASLGNNEFGQTKKAEIIERPYFSVCMVKKEDAYFDDNYDDLFDDSDLIMRIFSKGLNCYQNLKTIVEHKPHSTYGRPDLGLEKNQKQRRYFENKWSKYKDKPYYSLFA